jgi:hypothetical protein
MVESSKIDYEEILPDLTLSIFTTLLALILSKIPDEKHCPPPIWAAGKTKLKKTARGGKKVALVLSWSGRAELNRRPRLGKPI